MLTNLDTQKIMGRIVVIGVGFLRNFVVDVVCLQLPVKEGSEKAHESKKNIYCNSVGWIRVVGDFTS
jgi:hypothetical protein